MKKLSFLLLPCAALFLQACGGSTKTNSVDAAKDSNSAKDVSKMADSSAKKADAVKVNKTDADYAVEVANGVMMEVKMGKMVEQKAVSKGVKEFGAQMVTDHSKDVAALKAIAAQKNITLPDSVGGKEEKKYEELSKENGKEFDRDYVDFMVKDHKDDIKIAEEAIKNVKDPDLQAFAIKSLPVLKGHLAMIVTIQASLKK